MNPDLFLRGDVLTQSSQLNRVIFACFGPAAISAYESALANLPDAP